jgi:GT2 family glycosyltransferase
MSNDICIGVLHHNNPGLILRFLRALYGHTKDFYLLILDNNSSDNSVDDIEDFLSDKDNFRLLLKGSNLGVIGGRNELFRCFHEELSYDSLLILDNDQIVQEGWQVQYMDFRDSGDYDIIGVEGWQLRPGTFFPYKKCSSHNDFFNYVGCGGMMISREVVEKIGYFDDRFNPYYFEDPDYAMRASEEGFKLGWNSKNRIIHLAHQTIGLKGDKKTQFDKSHRLFMEKWKHKRNNLPVFRNVS